MEPRLKEAQEGDRAVFFVDAAHFVYGSFLGYLWTLTRLWVKTGSGRKRLNVLGALHAVTRKVIVETNDGYINAQTVCKLLHQIANRGYRTPITLVMDNARYQKCKLVEAVAGELGIELLFLPAYSPNLNLIERLWKFVKKRALASRYHEDFGAFCQAISDCIKNTTTTHKAELKTLLTLNFQTFENTQVLAG